MKHENSGSDVRELQWVTDPTQAKLLTDPVSVEFLSPFLARERTASQAAEELACSLDVMLYRIRVFLKAELLKVSRLQPRKGRPIKYYRSVADGFFIPFEVTPYAGLEERIAANFSERNERITRATARLLREVGVEGRRIYRGPDGDVWQEAAADTTATFNISDARAPAAMDFFRELRLTFDEAKALQRELLSYRERYLEEERAGQTYLFGVLLLPEG